MRGVLVPYQSGIPASSSTSSCNCPTRFPSLMMLCHSQQVSLVEQELLSLPEDLGSPARCFSRVNVARSLVSCVVLCLQLFFFLSYFFLPLYCLSFNFLITPLVSCLHSTYLLKVNKEPVKLL